MRRRVFGVLVAGFAMAASAVVAGSPASAELATWTVTPGGAFTGIAGQTILETENGVQLFCESSTADGIAQSGTALENPLATIPETPGIKFNNCQGPFGFTFTVTHKGIWELHGDTYDAATGVTTGRITNITADIVGPSCLATVTGSVDVTYTNDTDALRVLPNFSLTVSFVDPAADCGGLLTQGETANFDGSYAVTPDLTITSP